MLHGTTCATAGGTFLTCGAAFITLEAGALGRTARVAWATHLAAGAADALPGAELLRLTADAVFRRAHLIALARAMDFAAAAIPDDVIAFPFAEQMAGFRAARFVLLSPVGIVVMAPVPAATADDGPIATTTGVKRHRRVRIGGDEAEQSSERGA